MSIWPHGPQSGTGYRALRYKWAGFGRSLLLSAIMNLNNRHRWRVFYLCGRMGSIVFVTKWQSAVKFTVCRVVAYLLYCCHNQSSAAKKKKFPPGDNKSQSPKRRVQQYRRGFYHYRIMLACFQNTRARRIQIFSLILLSELLLWSLRSFTKTAAAASSATQPKST